MPNRRVSESEQASPPDGSGPYRLTTGGALIDRERPVAFFLNGVSHFGYEGDTLASALLAEGLTQTQLSSRYGRPRALCRDDAEEPNALYRIEDRRGCELARPAPMTPLCSGLKAFAEGAQIHPLGPIGRCLSALGLTGATKAPRRPSASDLLDVGEVEEFNFHTDVLVIGGGLAGIAAAKAALASGARVLLAERSAHWGGQALMSSAKIGRSGVESWVRQEIGRIDASEEGTARLSLEAVSLAGAEEALLLERPTSPEPMRRLWRVRARRVILASGSVERTLLFQNNDLPGVMTASAMRRMLTLYGVAAGRRVAVFTNNDSGYRAALDLHEAGVEIAAIVDPRPTPSGEAPRRALSLGLPLRSASVVKSALAGLASSNGRIAAVEIATLRESGRLGASDTVTCDALAVSGGWSPETGLFADAGGARIWDRKTQAARPKSADEPLILAGGAALTVAGAANGATGVGDALSQGLAAGKDAVKALGISAKRLSAPKISGDECEKDGAPSPLLLVAGLDPKADDETVFVDPSVDLTLAEVERAARGSGATVESMCAAVGLTGPLGASVETLAASVIADVRGAAMDTLFPQKSPPSSTPFAPRPMIDLLRASPIVPWQREHGAVWTDHTLPSEKTGWRLPTSYLRQSGPDGEMEDEIEAANRETRLARRGVAIHDLSHLAKFQIEGPDASNALSGVFSEEVSSADVGCCVLGFVTAKCGTVICEGVVSKLSKQSYLLHAPPQAEARLQEALAEAVAGANAQWADLTEVYAQFALIGPKSRLLLERLTEIDLSEDALPALAWRRLRLAGRDLRVSRLARGGGQGFELEVPAAQALGVWRVLFEVGEGLGLQPLGALAADILRIERGRVAPGREADGIAKAADLLPTDRTEGEAGSARRLVGLLSEDPAQEMPDCVKLYAGDGPRARVFAGGRASSPAPIGRVTSQCWSPTLERSIGLAMVEVGWSQHGTRAHMFDEAGRLVRVEIGPACFVKPSEQNIDGWRPL